MGFKEDDSNWFPELPLPEDLMPLSQTLITPHLALAFNIPSNPPPPPQPNSSAEELSPAGDEAGARTLKRPRLVWTPQLHKRFVDAVAHLGIKNAVPKTIMQLMSVDGLTRENVASHLQKYRLYLKRISTNAASSVDPATDHLFATSPVPPHFLPLMPPPPPHHHYHSEQFRYFEQPFVQRIGYADDLEPANGRKMLTLFPTGGD